MNEKIPFRDFFEGPWYQKHAAPFAVGFVLGLGGLFLLNLVTRQ